MEEEKVSELEDILNRMKAEGIGGGILKKDGTALYSTIALHEVVPSVIATSSNIPDALLRRMKNEQKEVEITFSNGILVISPMGQYLFFGVAKTKEEKRKILEYSQLARRVI
jgi:predicted regulator of Ras-like GTPase activity (Roadblock/LC7/MglB family)